MRRGRAVVAAATAALVLVGCGSSDGSEVPAADRAGVDAMVDAALDGGDPVECRFHDEDDTGTYIIGPGRTMRVNHDPDVAVWIREGEFVIWDRRDETGVRFGPELVAEHQLADLSGVDAIRLGGELGPCRPFHGDPAEQQPPPDADLTDIHQRADMFVWLVGAYDDERGSALFEVLFPESRAHLAPSFYLFLGMLLDRPDGAVRAYGEMSQQMQMISVERHLAALTETERRAYLDEVLGRLRPEHRRVVEQALAD